MKRAYLSLGSNLGDRIAKIRSALEELARAGIEISRVSSLYKTEPVEFRVQPWFVNCVAEVSTELLPLQLLRTVQAVERHLGRRPTRTPKGPRPIDIDILLYENVVLRSSELTVPHERLSERRFVLVPLRELAARLRHPVSQRTILELLRNTADSSRVIRLKNNEGL